MKREYVLYEGKYEYPKSKLVEDKAKYFYVPSSLIANTELGEHRVGIFSFLRIHYGLDCIAGFTIPDMVEWCGLKSNKRAGAINDKFLNILDALNDIGYLSYLTDRSRSSYVKCKFDVKFYGEECAEGYAGVYLDEVEKIMKYKRENPNDTYLSNNAILLVFAYLRHKIKRRPNELKPEERYPDLIEARRKRMPEAYNESYKDIASELKLSVRVVSKAMEILNDLKLIAIGEPYHIFIDGNEYRTPDMIYANFEKREKENLLISGEEYAYSEIRQHAENMNANGRYCYNLKRIS